MQVESDDPGPRGDVYGPRVFAPPAPWGHFPIMI